MRYTSNEILKLAGVETPDTIVGKMRVRIGGIAVRSLDHVINVLDTKVVVMVGNESQEVTLSNRTELSDEVRASIKAKGDKSTIAFNASQTAKGRMKAKDNIPTPV